MTAGPTASASGRVPWGCSTSAGSCRCLPWESGGRTATAASAWKEVRKLKGTPWFPLGFMIFWYAFVLLFPMMYASLSAYQDFILNAYLWLLLGILFRLPTIALSAQLGVSASPDNSQRRWIR